MVFQVVALAISGNYSVFLGISMNTQDIQVIKQMFVFLQLICLFIMGRGARFSVENLEGQRENYFSSCTKRRVLRFVHAGEFS